MNPKVSIGIPAYKPEFLEEAIASVLAQTFEDWELIVVDDYSPADIKGIVGKFTDQRISYYRNEQNIGAEDPSYNWNRCLEYACGEYFCLLCDDDVYHPTFLEEMLKLTEQFPSCNVFRAKIQIIDKDGNVTGRFPSSPLWESCEDYIWHRTRGMRHQTISEWMLRTQHLRDCGEYVHFPCAWASDVESIYRTCVDGGIASSYKVLLSFRNSGLNISMRHNKDLEKKLYALVMEREQTIELIQREGMCPELAKCVQMNQEYEARALLKHTDALTFVKMGLLRREQFGIRLKSFVVDCMRRLLACLMPTSKATSQIA